MVDKNKTVVCCLLATSAIMLSEKKKRKGKMLSKKWYLKRNISCDAHLLTEILETDVEHYINNFRMNEQTKTVLRPALLPVKTAQFTQFSFRYDVTQ
jgi:hypothetical protein